MEVTKWTLVEFFALLTLFSAALSDPEKEELPGNGKAFGYNDRPTSKVTSMEHLTPVEFIEHYVRPQQSVLIKGMFKNAGAVTKWTDDYFLAMENVPADNEVVVENKKKENRTNGATVMSFKSFVKIYNDTDQYMVNPVPDFLKKDVQVPFPLQCEQFLKIAAVEAMMWFSSGGTRSVVHTDSVDNLNCLVTGRKRFIIIPPKFKDNVPLDHPEGAYSGIDIDAVDYSKYPGLAHVEYLIADMVAGDCLYIPYKWIHQVESWDRNIAINIWWDTSRNSELELSTCNKEFDPNVSLDDLVLHGFEGIEISPAVIRDHIEDLLKLGDVNEDTLFNQLNEELEEYKDLPEYAEAWKYLHEGFLVLDKDGNGLLTRSDIDAAEPDDWNLFADNFLKSHHLFIPPEEREVDEGYGEHDEL